MINEISSLRSRKAKNTFFFTTILLLILEIILYTFCYFKENEIGQDLSNISREITADLIAATLTSMIIGGLVFYLLPKEKAIKSVELLEPRDTKKMHDWALKNTNFWYHIGHTARWVRIEAMSYLSKYSIENGVQAEVKAIILNPKNIELCKLYADYRNRISFKEKGENKSSESIRVDIFATILTSKLYNENNCGLTVQLFITDNFTIFREDTSEKCVFRTKPNPKSPSLMFKNRDGEFSKYEFYNGAKTDFQISIKNCKEIELDAGQLSKDLTLNEVKDYLASLNILENPNNQFLEKIIKQVKSDYHPYT